MLEHLPQAAAPGLIAECLRVLKPGGILRVVVPDLETIARFYLRECEAAATGDREAARRHEWMTIELLDQLVREKSGGEMLHYWRQNPMPAEPFVIERVGGEVRDILGLLRSGAEIAKPPPRNEREVARFRASGEVHKWMYDRVSLRALLAGAGFSEIRVCTASESRIPHFASFHLDTDEAGLVRKPDSLFMEAAKP